MKKTILPFIIIGGVGTLAHFVYDWTGQNSIVGIFSAVNESTWEHLKLLFFPAVIYSLIEYFICKEKPENFFPAVFLGVLSGMLSIVVLFYTYSGVLGFNVDFLNILIYFIGVIIFIKIKNKIINQETFNKKNAVIVSIVLLGVFAFLFGFWTFNPPSLGIFTPPVIPM